MVTITNNSTAVQLEIFGLSTDTKPTGQVNGKDIPNGSYFFEMDTQNVVFYDGDSKSWLED